jgi:transcriptional regulator with XRE-family HTH domain
MFRICQWCERQLSAYNRGDQCGACAVAARSDPLRKTATVLPLSFWFRRDVANALAGWDWQTVLNAVTKETGVTQTRLGSAIGVSQAQISRLLSGATREPGIRTVLGIVDRLGIPRVLAGLAPRGLDALSKAREPTVTVDRVKRREFGRGALGLALAFPLAGAGGKETVDIARLAPDQVTRDLYALGARHGGGAVVDIARRRLAGLTRRLDRTSLAPSAETRAHVAVGALATCAAWLCADAGDVDGAHALDADALYAAHAANDKELQVEALLGMANKARYLDRPGEAGNLAESALSIARGLDPSIRCRLSIEVAVNAAHRRDAETFQRLRGQAWRFLEMARDADRPAWLQFLDEYALMGFEAGGLMSLRRYGEATEMYEKAVSEQSNSPKNRALDTARWATALLRERKCDEAISVVHDGMPLFVELNSVRVASALGEARTALRPYENSPDAAECSDILAELLKR